MQQNYGEMQNWKKNYQNEKKSIFEKGFILALQFSTVQNHCIVLGIFGQFKFDKFLIIWNKLDVPFEWYCIVAYLGAIVVMIVWQLDLQLPMHSLPITTLWVWIPLRRNVLDTTLCDDVCQWLATGRWFSPGTPVFSSNKNDCHDITELLLQVVLNTITLTPRTLKSMQWK